MATRKSRFRLIRTKAKQVDLDPQGSRRKGLVGVYETILRRFKTLTQILTLLPLYVVASLCLGLAIAPAISTYSSIMKFAEGLPSILPILLQGFSLALSYFVFGFTLMFVAPFFNFLFRAYPTAQRGPYFSAAFLSWYIHNGLTYLVRYTFLEFITPTPFNLLFFKMMGMKIGRNCQVNTSNISDPSLIELGDRVTIGGSATVIAHYGQAGFLVLAPTKIGNGVTLGMKCTVMGGAKIGDDVKILPNSVVLPKTVIPAGEIWGGVPAVKII